MSSPLVAVAVVRLGPGRIGSWEDSGEAIQSAYLAGLRRGGSIPVGLGGPDEADPERLLDPFDGLVLLGGPDVDPATYGEATGPHVYGIDPVRDRFEMGLARAALGTGLPLLAICRGIQVLNVATGGTLVQDLGDAEGPVRHGRPVDGTPGAHPVDIEPSSRLQHLAGGALRLDDCVSVHHQAIKTVGLGLVVTGRSPDGVIEAVETPAGSPAWCVGVQWHPERSAARDAAQQALFDGFVAVCSATARIGADR